jgi:uncharacterized protein (TIGR03086 family)
MEGPEQLAVIIPMLKDVARRIDHDQFANSTPCTQFTVENVLEHMSDLASGFAPMFRGEVLGEPEKASAPPDADVTTQFDRAMDELLDAVQSPGALDHTIQTPGGPMPGAVFARLVALDGLVHGWDLASSTEQSWEPPEAIVSEIDAFARQAITPEMRDGHAFAAEQTPPERASTMLRLAAFTGRAVPGR